MTTSPALLTIREWRLKNNRLGSLTMRGEWSCQEMFAAVIPSRDNNHGIYSFTPEAFLKRHYGRSFWTRPTLVGVPVAGVCACRGQIQIHEDGTVRSQAAEIVQLFIDSNLVSTGQCTQIRDYYGVPCVYTDSIRASIRSWLAANRALVDAQKGLAEAYRVTKDSIGQDSGIVVEQHRVVRTDAARHRAWRFTAAMPTILIVMTVGMFFVSTMVNTLIDNVGETMYVYQTDMSAQTVEQVALTTRYIRMVKDLGFDNDGNTLVLLQKQGTNMFTLILYSDGELARVVRNTNLELVDMTAIKDDGK